MCAKKRSNQNNYETPSWALDSIVESHTEKIYIYSNFFVQNCVTNFPNIVKYVKNAILDPVEL
jgi:hypothetical protein